MLRVSTCERVGRVKRNEDSFPVVGDSAALSVGGSRVPRIGDVQARDEELVALLALLGDVTPAADGVGCTRPGSPSRGEVTRRGAAIAV